MYVIILDYEDIERELVEQGYNLGDIEWMEISTHSLKMLGMQIFENI